MSKLKNVSAGKNPPDKLQEQIENKPASMFTVIENLLDAFKSVLPAPDHFFFFCSWIIGLILANDDVGSDSALMRGLKWSARRLYDRLSRFIHSPKWKLEKLKNIWIKIADNNFDWVKTSSGAAVGIIDQTSMSKDGIRMPGLSRLETNSSSKSKKKKTNGLLLGQVCGLIKTRGPNGKESYPAVPLYTRRHKGFAPLACFRKSKDKQVQKRIEQLEDDEHLSLIEKMAIDAIKVFLALKTKKFLILCDRGFFSEKLLKIIQDYNSLGKGHIDVVVRCKCSAVVHEKLRPEQVRTGKRGRPRKKGDRVKLSDLFECPNLFHRTTAMIYGKKKTIYFYCLNRLWHGFELRFVLTRFYDEEKEKERRMILFSTDLKMDPVEIIQLYCFRFRIEQSFRDLKVFLHLNSGRFNSHKAPKHSRYPKKLERLYQKITDPKAQIQILDSVLAMEAFIFFSNVALGVVYYLCKRYELRTDILDEDFSCVPEKDRKATVTTIQQTLRKHYMNYVCNGPQNSFLRKFLYSYVHFEAPKNTDPGEKEESNVIYVQGSLFEAS